MKKEILKQNKFIGMRAEDWAAKKFKEEGGSILEFYRQFLRFDVDDNGNIKFSGSAVNKYDLPYLKILEKHFSPHDFVSLICQIDDLTDLVLNARKNNLKFFIASKQFRTHNGSEWSLLSDPDDNAFRLIISREKYTVLEAYLSESNFFYNLKEYLLLGDEFKEKQIKLLLKEFNRIKFRIVEL